MSTNQKYANIAGITRIIGSLVALVGVFMLLSSMVSLYYFDDAFWALIISAAICFVVGFLARYASDAPDEKVFKRRDGFLTVTLAWTVISLFGTLPYLIYGAVPTVADAFFESVSGFTTTGATIISDVEALPKGLLFWRALTHWIGGIGIVVFSLAILPIMGIGGNHLFAAESTGPTKDKFHPRIAEIAKRLCAIYISLTLLQTILLCFAGMDFFDAVCHAFSTIATGGFSTKNNSIMDYSSNIQLIFIVFMFLAGINFSLYYYAMIRKFSKIKNNSELKGYVVFTLFFSLLLYVMLRQSQGGFTVGEGLQNSLFTTISIITTTGFIAVDYSSWNNSIVFLIFILFFLGACAGSTTGGIKISRHVLLLKNALKAFKQIMHPRAVLPVKMNGEAVPQQVITKVLAFFFLYIVIFVIGSLSMSFLGYDLETSMGMSASALGNVGPGIGSICATCSFASVSFVAKWMMSLLMIIGRLELFTVLIIFTPAFWKK